MKAIAVAWTAAGKSVRETAEAAEVAPSTVSKWRRDPKFVEEVERTRAVCAGRPLDGVVLKARLDEVRERFAAP